MLNWNEIAGWSEGTERVYDHVARTCDPEAVLVEVGVWFGRSIVMLAQLLKQYGKELVTVYGIDAFADSPAITPEMRTVVEGKGGTILETVRQNLVAAEVDRQVKLVQADSADAAGRFADGEVDFVYIDADHRYQGVSRDIRAWLPKVRKGGTIAGHDFSYPDVARAVQELLPSAVGHGSVWVKVK
jgi:hypothetical protein